MTSTETRCLCGGCLAGAWLLLAAAGGSAAEQTAGSLADAMTSSRAHIALRYRYEHVDQEGFQDNAQASTLRLRLGLATGSWRKWTALAEFDYVGEALLDEFNSGTSPERSRYPVVADPAGADLNQLYAEYDGIPDWLWRFGRQRILLDDERFVGGVGWRQNEQTFDAVRLIHTGLAGVETTYAFVANVNRIFGDTVAAGDHRMATHLVNMKVKVNETLAATPYVYYIDNDDAPAASTATFGVRVTGGLALGTGTVTWLAELASQSDAANAPVDFAARYWRLDGQWAPGQGGLSLGLGLESLGGDQAAPGQAFRTPLATLHAFQGWADQFLTTPDAGIEDRYGSITYPFGGWDLRAVLHDFSAESGSADYGRELDLSASRSFGERYGVMLKAAFFEADRPPLGDADKAWVVLTARY